MLRCTGRANPSLLYVLALGVRLLLIALFPDPAYPDSSYYVDVARALAAGTGFNVDFIWIFAEVGGTIPAEPGPADPVATPTGCRSRRSSRSRSSGSSAPTAIASALPFALIGSLAAPLTWAIARDAGARRVVAIGAGVLTALPAAWSSSCPSPTTSRSIQPLVAGGAVAGRARAQGRPARRSSRPALLVGLATLVAQRRRPRRRGARRSSFAVTTAGAPGARRRRGAPGDPAGRRPSAASALFLLVMAPWWVRQLAVFGSDLAVDRRRAGSCSSGRSPSGTSITTPATLDVPRPGPRAAAVEPDRRVRRRDRHLHHADRRRRCPAAVHGRRRLGSAADRPTSGRSSCTSRSCSRSRRSSRRSTSRAARSSTRRSRSRRTPTSSRSRASRSPSPGSPRGGRAGTARPRRALFSRRRSSRSSSRRRLGSRSPRARLGRRARQPARRRRRARPPPAPPPDDADHVDRRRRLSRYWTGRGGVVTPNDPIETIEAVAAPTTIALAGRRARRHRRGARAGPRRRARPAWIGPPVCADPGRRRARLDRPDPAPRQRCARRLDAGRRDGAGADEPPRGLVLPALARLRASRSSSGRLRRVDRRLPDSPRTPPTTSASPATCSRAAASSSDAIWSFQTPPLVFPRPAFEVWLPLPTFLAAIPMALFGPTFAAAQIVPVLVGSIVPVLAWRLGARRRRRARPVAGAGPGPWRRRPG